METEAYDIEELIKLLKQRPQWRERLLQVLLTDEFLRLPSRMDHLEVAVTQLTEQVQALTQQVQALAEGQRQLQIRVGELTEGQRQLRIRVDELTEGQKQLQLQMQSLTAQVQSLTEQVMNLTHQVRDLTNQVREIASTQKGMLDDLGYLKGRDRERFYRENAPAVLGRYLQKIRVIDKGKLLEQMNAAKDLTDDEWLEIVNLDLAVEAVTKQTSRQLILAMEVSWVIDGKDVGRAVRRAELMRERGLPAIPVVAGKGLLPDAKDSAFDQRVLVVLDGRIFNKEFLG